MLKRKSNPGYGKAFTFHGSFVSLILARRREKEIPGSFIHQHKGRYYVLKPKKIRTNAEYSESKKPRMTTRGARQQINNLKKQGWSFDKTVEYPSGLINHILLKEGKTAILNTDGSIKMLYPVGTKVFDILKDRIVEQGLGSSPNPRKKRSCYVIPNRKRTKHNPSQVLIYGRVLKIFAQKTSGPYKGERFVHEFKPGALMYGMPDGSLKIIHK